MLRHSWFQVFRSLGLEFWLLLPVLGLFAWTGSGLVTNWVLSRSFGSEKALLVDTQTARVRVLSIAATINSQQGFTRVKIKTTHSVLRVVEYEFLLTERSEVEAAISQVLGVPLVRVRQAIRYQSF